MPTANRITSQSLLEQLTDRDNEQAWGQFEVVYGPMLRYWLYRKGVNEHDADDLIQEILQKALIELPTFEHNGHAGALRCWLRRTMANRLRTHWRRQNKQGQATGGSDYIELANQLEDPQSDLSATWDREYQEHVCERLIDLIAHEFSPQTMQAFRRATMDDQTTRQVADELGMTPNAVRIAQSRVIRRLREIAAGLID